jgi:hypothetical protein
MLKTSTTSSSSLSVVWRIFAGYSHLFTLQTGFIHKLDRSKRMQQ